MLVSEPVTWLGRLIIQAGDIEVNPGPRKCVRTAISSRSNNNNNNNPGTNENNNDAETYNFEGFTNCERYDFKGFTEDEYKKQTKQTNDGKKTKIKIVQFNANGINNKIIELQQLIKKHMPEVICIQETKLSAKQAPPSIEGYSSEVESRDRDGGGVLTYIRADKKFTRLKTIKTIDEAQLLKTKIHLKPKVSITISNLYITPQHLPTEQDDTLVKRYLREAMKEEAVVVTDINGHSRNWFDGDNTDHRGNTIEEVVEQSDSIVINENQPTRIPFNRGNNQAQPSAPDITIIPNKLAIHTTWKTEVKLSSDHLPIIIEINSGSTHKKEHRTFTNYNKADWEKFEEYVEEKIAEGDHASEDPHILNSLITKVINQAANRFIPKGSIRSKSTPIPEQIRAKMALRNQLRSEDPNNIDIVR